MIDEHLLEQWSWQSVEQATAQTKDPGKWRKLANARFAELVEAHVREQCAQLCESMFSDGALDIAAAIRAARAP